MQYVTGVTCCNILNGPSLWGLSFLEGLLVFRLRASNHTLSSETKKHVGISGLMCLSKAFCASALDCISSLRRSYIAGTGSSGIVSDAVGLMPMINSCGVCFMCLCFQELCANSVIGNIVLQLFCWPETNCLR